MQATNHYEEIMLNTFRGASAVAPATMYLALYLNNPGESGAGTEVAYTGYQRQAIEFSEPAAIDGQRAMSMTNLQEITFPTTPIAIGTVTHLGVMDSQSGGNMYLYGEFTESLDVQANEAPVIVAGEAIWQWQGQMSNPYRQRCMNLLRKTNLTGFMPYLALYNGTPEGGGSELSGDGYARLPLVFSSPAEQTGGQMMISNSEAVSSNRSLDAWGTWAYTAVFDDETEGSPVYWVPRTPTTEVRKGQVVTVEENSLHLSVN